MRAPGFYCAISVREGSTPTAGTASPLAWGAWLCYISTCEEIKHSRARSGDTRNRLFDRRGALCLWGAADRRHRYAFSASLHALDPVHGAGGGLLRRGQLRAAERRHLCDRPTEAPLTDRLAGGDLSRNLPAGLVGLADPDVLVIDGVSVDLPVVVSGPGRDVPRHEQRGHHRVVLVVVFVHSVAPDQVKIRQVGPQVVPDQVDP